MAELPRYLQLLWGREPQGRRGPKPGRTIEEIGAAAIAIADRDGLDAVSMKGVAGSLGLTTMSLYRYVDSKDELSAVMFDVALGPPDINYGRKGWRARVSMWAKQIANRRRGHPWTASIVLTSPPLTPNVLAWMEVGLAAFDHTPLTGLQRLSAMLAIDGWGLNHVRQTSQMGLAGAAEPGSPQDSYLQFITELIDPGRFPHLAAAGPEALDDDDADFFEDEFDRGLALFLDGLEALIARAAR